MRHLKLFEKWGISSDIEEQASEFINFISKKNENKFLLTYSNNKGNYFFYLIIDEFDDKNQKGNFHYDTVKGSNEKIYPTNFEITIKNRDDYTTLLHELKHLDRITRTGIDKNIINIGLHWSKKLKNKTKLNRDLVSTFYTLNTDEFEAKYHSYYASIDKHLSNIFRDKTPNKDEVLQESIRYLKNQNDKSYTYWVDTAPIDLLELESKPNLLRLFNGFLNGNVDSEFPKKIDSKTLSQLIKFVRHKLNMISKVDNDNFNKVKKIIESELNRNRIKFNKKFRRIFSLMIEKYAV